MLVKGSKLSQRPVYKPRFRISSKRQLHVQLAAAPYLCQRQAAPCSLYQNSQRQAAAALAAAPYLCQQQAAHAAHTKTVCGMCSAASAAAPFLCQRQAAHAAHTKTVSGKRQLHVEQLHSYASGKLHMQLMPKQSAACAALLVQLIRKRG